MGFNESEVVKLLVACHRRCCVCHKFCGVKMELHHIKEKINGGDDSIENAIPVCFECHAEIASYNPKHPRGRKFSENELRLFKNNWIKICKKTPSILVESSNRADVGPLQALYDEMEFNEVVSSRYLDEKYGLFQEKQFKRAIEMGVLSIVHNNLKRSIYSSYLLVSKANGQIKRYLSSLGGGAQYPASNVNTAISEVKIHIEKTKNLLLEFLSGNKS